MMTPEEQWKFYVERRGELEHALKDAEIIVSLMQGYMEKADRIMNAIEEAQLVFAKPRKRPEQEACAKHPDALRTEGRRRDCSECRKEHIRRMVEARKVKVS